MNIRCDHDVLKWLRRVGTVCGLVLALVALPSTAQQRAALKLRIVGGLASVNQYVHYEEPFWTQQLSARSGGRYSADIVPFDRAGVPGTQMLTLMKLGVVPFGTALLGQAAVQYPALGAPDLAGLNPDMASLKRVVGAFRPYLERTLRERHGVELLAVYVYPAQVIFCTKPLNGLKDLNGRRTRVSSGPQSDFVAALGGVPVLTQFSEIMSSMRSGNTDCAITGTLSGRTLGLDKITQSVYMLPINWGLAIFGANKNAWRALPDDLKAILRTELPKLEASVWAESERETARGLDCSADKGCGEGADALKESRPSDADQAQRRLLFADKVLPSWVQRCGPECARVWDSTIGPVVGIKAPAAQ